MANERDRCAEFEEYKRIDAAFRAGDLAALRAALGNPAGFPNVRAHPAMGLCLIYAIYHSPLRLIRALLEAGADPNIDPQDGFPSLQAALSSGVSAPGAAARPDVHEILELLLAHGADVQQRGVNDYTSLHTAAAQGDLGAVDVLLTHGADPHAVTRIDDVETALGAAERAGHQAVVARLREVTVRPDWERAARNGDVTTLARLLAAGVDIDSLDAYSQTALMRAAAEGHEDAVVFLARRGADLNHTAKYHLSALMLAIVRGHAGGARALVEAGADLAIRGSGAPGFEGKTALDLAEARGDRSIVDLIRRAADQV
jgi:ankyrin repeat protein